MPIRKSSTGTGRHAGDTNASALRVTEADRSALQQVTLTSLETAKESIQKAGSPELAMREQATDGGNEAAARLTRNAFSDLRTAADFATWAKAKFSQGQFKDAVRAYAEAVRLAPDDPELRLNYAVALYYENRDRPNSDIQSMR